MSWLRTRSSAERRRRSPSSHWNSAFSTAYGTPSKVAGASAAFEHVGPLSALDHAHRARLALDRARPAERLQPRLEPVVLRLELTQVLARVRGGVPLLDPVADRPDVEQHDHAEH